MTQEEKQLLLKDLSARLPHGVKIWIKWDKNPSPLTTSILGNYWCTVGDDIKPYLRPMSNMTKEEVKEFDEFICIDEDAWNGNGIQGYINQAYIMSNALDWLNSHHFDFRGLIEKGLALEAPKDMYKTE